MKIIKLIENETIKTLKKTSTKILIFLSIIALLAAVGFANLVMALNNMGNYYIQNQGDQQNAMKEEIVAKKKEIETEGKHYDRETIATLKAQVDTYEIALKYDINYLYFYNYNYWKVQILSEIESAKINFLLNGDSESEKIINQRVKLLANNDYSGYIELLKQNEKIRLDKKEITKEEYDDNIYLLQLREKYEIYKEDKEMSNWKESVYEDITLIKQNLRAGINRSTGKLLKLEEIEELEDNLKIAEYRLKNNIPVLSSISSSRGLYDIFAPAFSMIMVSILMIIIAGSAISTEISKGTIKFLLFTPNKRWKVLLSKIISAVLLLLALSLILSLLSVIIGNIFFKDSGTVYVYISNGEVKYLSNIVYTILYFLVSSIDILVYMLFAFMLSVLTRNTALSVGLSIACYIGSGIIMELVNFYISADWVKFIPFNNLGLTDRIFTNNISYLNMQNASGFMSGTSVGFSLIVLLVCAILMITSMFDSFNKRDIV